MSFLPRFAAFGLGLFLAFQSDFTAAAEDAVRLNEFLAANSGGLEDEDHESSDWIELFNPTTTTVSMEGWALTDDPARQQRWFFPATNLPPRGYMVVFASGKNRRLPGLPLHTDFKLSASGEYLGLLEPGATNAVSEFAPIYRPQWSNVSFGVQGAAADARFIPDTATLRYVVPVDGKWGVDWRLPNFDDLSWNVGPNGLGYEIAPEDYSALIQTDVRSQMLNKATGCFIRIPFQVEDPSKFSNWRLRIKYDDGFASWVNGINGPARNAPGSLQWNSIATAGHPDSQAVVPEEIALPAGAIKPGINWLAIHGLNLANNNSDFLIHVDVIAQSSEASLQPVAFFTQPTPGSVNIGGLDALGPLIRKVSHAPQVPEEGEALTVTAVVEPTAAQVREVILRYRVMFDAEVELPMADDGAHGDGKAGDGVYGAIIPASEIHAGQMIRYFIVARDAAGLSMREPLFPDPLASEQYRGTVVRDPSVVTALPIFQLFVATAEQGKIDGESGGRVAVFFRDELYDNVLMEVRGNTTAGCLKKSHRLEFPPGRPLKYDAAGGTVRRTSLMADYADPAYLRQHLSFWLMNRMGLHAPFYDAVRVQMNGAFYQLAYHSDVLGEEQLERFGLDPLGALYKACGIVDANGSSTGGFQKKTREWEGTADYVDFANAIRNGVAAGQRKTNLFDRVDLPQVINYMAAARIMHEEDDIWANMSLYRDSNGDQEWRCIPFDLNLSWGQIYGSGSVQSTVDTFKSHPLYGNSRCVQAGGPFSGYNHFYDAIIQTPETRQMLLRRIRTIMDAVLQPPGTPPELGIIEQHIRSMTNAFWPEAFLDRKKWGWPVGCGPYGFGSNLWLTNGVTALQNQFLIPRRRHLYQTHSITNTAKAIGIGNAQNAGIPLPEPADASIQFGDVEFLPASGNQTEEYVQLVNTNNYAVDLSGWKLTGGIRFEFAAGTVIPSNSVAYLASDVLAFRSRRSGPSGNQAKFVLGPFKGQLSARGEVLALLRASGETNAVYAYAGRPTDAQQWLRISEIHYHPADPEPGSPFTGSDFEFVELANISATLPLSLAGIQFTEGIRFLCPPGTLAPGETALVVSTREAFERRYGQGKRILGTFEGALNNAGDRLRLVDANGEEIEDASIDPQWYPTTDGGGASLERIDWEPSLASARTSWSPSTASGGTPGMLPSTVFQIEGISVVDGHLKLRFTGEVGRSYRIEGAPDLAPGNWTSRIVVPPLMANGIQEVELPLTEANSFYRIVRTD